MARRHTAQRAWSPIVTSDLESFPGATVMWSSDRNTCVLNSRAKKLLGFTEVDFRKDPSLWIRRIHPQDHSEVQNAWRRLNGGAKTVIFDFRFFPKKTKKAIWLREVSAFCQNPKGSINVITSNYTDISDLKTPPNGKEDIPPNAEAVVGGVVHEMQNNLQVINLGVDLARQSPASPLESQEVVSSIARTDKTIQELREFFLPPSPRFSKENPGTIVQTVVQQMEKELQRQGIKVRLIRPAFLPMVQLDERQFRKMIERVVEFSRALLPKGGVLEIRTGLKRIRGQRFVELKVASSSAMSLELREQDVFKPFLRIHGYQVGLSIELAQQILRRHHGKIIFQKQTPKKGQFTILLRARPN